MATRNRHKRHIQFEALERRETPSTVAGGVHHHHATKHTHPAPTTSASFHGSGTGHVVDATTTTVQGKASRLGKFTGTLTGTTGGQSSTAVLTGSNGSALDLSLTGSYNHSRTPLRNGSFPIMSGNFRFKVTGGTSTFNGATGSGHLEAQWNTAYNGVTFHFQGVLKQPKV